MEKSRWYSKFFKRIILKWELKLNFLALVGNLVKITYIIAEMIKYLDENFSGNENYKKIVKSSSFCSEDNNIVSDNYKITENEKIGIIPPIGGG